MENNKFDQEIMEKYQDKISSMYNNFLREKVTPYEKLLNLDKGLKEPECSIDFSNPETIEIDKKDAKELVLNDLNIIKEEFGKFQNKVAHLGSFPYFLDQFEEFANFGEYIGHLIEEFDEIEAFMNDNGNLEEVSQYKHEFTQLAQIRNNILISIYLYYKG